MPKTKTKRKLAQDACVCVCLYTIYHIRYTIYTSLVKDVSFTIFDWWKINDFFAVSLSYPRRTFSSQARVLHAVRLNERLTFKTFWLRQSETSSENTQKWPETTKRLQTVYRVIYHTRTIISQPKNANIVNVEFSLVKSILIFNLISFSLSLSYVASILGPCSVQIKTLSIDRSNLFMHCIIWKSNAIA